MHKSGLQLEQILLHSSSPSSQQDHYLIRILVGIAAHTVSCSILLENSSQQQRTALPVLLEKITLSTKEVKKSSSQALHGTDCSV